MSLYVIGDTHLSFATNKPMDIFGGWTDYVNRLEKNWNEIVNDEDSVVIAGDISWAMNFEQLKPDFEFINRLKGQKYILKGNHDYWWNTMKKMNVFLEENHFDTIKILHNNAYLVGDIVICGSRGWFYDAAGEQDGKVLAREVGRLKMSIDAAKELGDNLVAFLHYPPVMGEQVCEDFVDLINQENIKKCYYGHLHGDFTNYTPYKKINKTEFMLISADYLGFSPKLIEKF